LILNLAQVYVGSLALFKIFFIFKNITAKFYHNEYLVLKKLGKKIQNMISWRMFLFSSPNSGKEVLLIEISE